MVRAWIAQRAAWLDIQPDPDVGGRDDGTAPKLDRGERTVIALALAVRADLVLMDDQAGVTVARRRPSTPSRFPCDSYEWDKLTTAR